MISVRRASPADVTKVAELRTRLYTESAQSAGNGHLSSDQQWRCFHDCLGFLLDPYSILLLAFDGDDPVGMLAIRAGGLVGFYKEQGVTVTWAYVHPDYRDGRVLLPLIRTGEKAVMPNASVSIQATIRSDNPDMMEAATKLGYNPIAVIVEKRMHGRARRRNAVEEVHEAGSWNVEGRTGGSITRP